jgi:hypothetical protein
MSNKKILIMFLENNRTKKVIKFQKMFRIIIWIDNIYNNKIKMSILTINKFQYSKFNLNSKIKLTNPILHIHQE